MPESASRPFDSLAETAEHVATREVPGFLPAAPDQLRSWARWLRELPDADVRVSRYDALLEQVWDNDTTYLWMSSFDHGPDGFAWLLDRILGDAENSAVVDLELDLEDSEDGAGGG